MHAIHQVATLMPGAGIQLVIPPEDLRRWVQLYWVGRPIAADHRGPPRHPLISRPDDYFTILPDGCVDFVVQCAPEPKAWFFGTTTRPVAEPIDGTSVYFGIRFHPGTIWRFLPIEVCDLTDTAVSLSELPTPDAFRALKEVCATDENVLTGKSLASAATELLRAYLLGGLGRTRGGVWLRPSNQVDKVDRALRIISAQPGISVESLASAAATSSRQLERLFLLYVGVSPKNFMRIVRGQYVLAQLRSGTSRLSDLALDAGYADQCHMTRDLRRLFGSTPHALAKNVGFVQDGETPVITE